MSGAGAAAPRSTLISLPACGSTIGGTGWCVETVSLPTSRLRQSSPKSDARATVAAGEGGACCANPLHVLEECPDECPAGSAPSARRHADGIVQRPWKERVFDVCGVLQLKRSVRVDLRSVPADSAIERATATDATKPRGVVMAVDRLDAFFGIGSGSDRLQRVTRRGPFRYFFLEGFFFFHHEHLSFWSIFLSISFLFWSWFPRMTDLCRKNN